jgi:hypothetical protein
VFPILSLPPSSRLRSTKLIVREELITDVLCLCSVLSRRIDDVVARLLAFIDLDVTVRFYKLIAFTPRQIKVLRVFEDRCTTIRLSAEFLREILTDAYVFHQSFFSERLS